MAASLRLVIDQPVYDHRYTSTVYLIYRTVTGLASLVSLRWQRYAITCRTPSNGVSMQVSMPVSMAAGLERLIRV